MLAYRIITKCVRRTCEYEKRIVPIVNIVQDRDKCFIRVLDLKEFISRQTRSSLFLFYEVGYLVSLDHIHHARLY